VIEFFGDLPNYKEVVAALDMIISGKAAESSDIWEILKDGVQDCKQHGFCKHGAQCTTAVGKCHPNFFF